MPAHASQPRLNRIWRVHEATGTFVVLLVPQVVVVHALAPVAAEGEQFWTGTLEVLLVLQVVVV